MNKKQIALLFAINLTVYFTGNAIVPLLPVYTARLGADVSATGLYLALAFAALTAGSLAGGWLSDRLQSRKGAILLAAAVSLPATYLMGQVSSLALFACLLVLVWFVGGITFTAVNILAGMQAQPSERGRVFGLIGLSQGIAQVIGGMVAGLIVEWWGFEALFVTVAGAWLLQFAYIPLVEDRPGGPVAREKRPATPASAAGLHSAAFASLVFASIMAYAIRAGASLSRPVAMDALGYSPIAITSTSAIAGLVALPLPVFLAWLSDRLGRHRALALIYVASAVGALTLSLATRLEIFWISTVLLTMTAASVPVGSALVADLAPKEALATAMARLTATPWIGSVLGYGGSGLVVGAFGVPLTFAVASVLPLVAAGLVLSACHSALVARACYATQKA